MQTPSTPIFDAINRRTLLARAVATTAASLLPVQQIQADEPAANKPTICAFIKFVQSLSYSDMADSIAEIGFDGIESTVRRGGHVNPERVEEDLPRQVEAVRKAGMEVTIMTTDVLGVDQPLTEKVLRTGAELGIKKYRMGFYRYNPKRNVIDQLNELRPRVRELAALNRELGMSAVYQNHSGANFVGAPIWDVHYLLEGIPVEEVGSAFDIRHAMVEGGLSWPLQYNLMKPHVGAVFVKDFQWDGERPKHVPLGEGRVNKKFFQMHQHSGIECPYSVHVEYLGRAGAKENLAALKSNYNTLKSWL